MRVSRTFTAFLVYLSATLPETARHGRDGRVMTQAVTQTIPAPPMPPMRAGGCDEYISPPQYFQTKARSLELLDGSLRRIGRCAA